MDTSDERREAIIKELLAFFQSRARVEERLGDERFEDSSWDDPVNLRHIGEVVQFLRPVQWQAGERLDAVKTVIKGAVRRLSTDPVGSGKSRVTWQRLASVMYDYKLNQYKSVTGRLDAHILKQVFQRADSRQPTDRSKQNWAARSRELLADQLLDMEAVVHRNRQTASEAVGYLVDRPKVQRDLEDAIYGQWLMTWVDGQPGVGKNKAVERILPKGSDDVVWIDCVEDRQRFDDTLMHEQIQVVLDDYDQPSDGGYAVLRKRFIRLLCSSKSPPHVVIDNYDESAFPELAQQREYSSQVTVLSRRPPPKKVKVCRVPIVDLTDPEADELICHFIPEATPNDREALTRPLFNRALLLTQISMEIQESTDLTIRQYLESIKTSRAFFRFIDTASDDVNRSIGAHYEFLIDRMQQRDRLGLALRLLDMTINLRPDVSLREVKLLWSEMYPIHERHVVGTDMASSSDFAVSVMVRNEVNLAVELLTGQGVIEQTGRDLSALSIHPLTRKVIGVLREANQVECRPNLIRGLNSQVRRWGWRAGEILSDELVYLIYAVMPAVHVEVFHHQEVSSRIDTFIDELEFTVALFAQMRQQGPVYPDDSIDLAQRVLYLDKRKLVILYADGSINLAEPADLDPAVLAAPPSTKIGCSSLLNQAATYHGLTPTLRKRFQIYLGIVGIVENVGITIPTIAWRACRELSVGLGIHSVVTGGELADCREALLRQSEGKAPTSQRDQVDDYQKLLLYGRFLASIGNIQRAVDVVTLNARKLELNELNVECSWLLIESLRVAADTLLRAGRIHEALHLCFTIRVAVQDRHEHLPSGSVGHSPSHFSDNRMFPRLAILYAEVEMAFYFGDSLVEDESISEWIEQIEQSGRRPVQTPQGMLDRIQKLAHAAYSRWNLHRECPDRSLRFDLFDQALRFCVLADYYSDDPSSFESIAEDLAGEFNRLAAMGGGEYALAMFIPMVILWIEHKELVEGTLGRLLASARITDDLVILGEFDSTLGERRRLSQIREECTAWIGLAYRLEIIADCLDRNQSHWYGVTRLRVVASCLAIFNGVEDGSIISRSIDAARKYGREDWVSILQSIGEDPSLVLELLGV